MGVNQLKPTERKILQAATKLFSEDGYNGVSTKRIAKEAGVNEITIFRLFKTKSDLLQAVIRDFAFEGNIVKKIADDLTGDIKKDLHIFAEVYYMFLVNNIKMYKIQLREIAEEGMTFTNSIDYVHFMSEYLEEKVKAGEFKGNPRPTAAELIALIFGLFTFNVYNPKLYTDEVKHDTILTDYINRVIEKFCT